MTNAFTNLFLRAPSVTEPLSAALMNRGVSAKGARSISIQQSSNTASEFSVSRVTGDAVRAAKRTTSTSEYLNERNPETRTADRTAQDENNIIRVVPDLDEYYMRMRFAKYVRPDMFANDNFETEMTLVLPLPRELRDDLDIRYSSDDLSLVGDLMAAVTSEGVTGAVGAGLLRMGGAAGGIAAAVGAIPGVGGIVQQAGFSQQNIVSAVQYSAGAAPNPNPVVMFEGPTLREFFYSWVFLPESPEESRTILNTIKEMKKRSLPYNAYERNASVLRYPNLVRVNFFPWDTDGSGRYQHGDNSIIKIKTAVIRRMNVMYNPDSPPAFFEGTKLPISIGLTMGLQEVEYLLASDFGREWSSKDGFDAISTTQQFARDLWDDVRSAGSDVMTRQKNINSDIGIGQGD